MDRTVLGIYDGLSGGATLLRGGRILATEEEDRLVRWDRTSGLPRASIQAVLRRTDMSGDRLTAVLVATRDATYAEGVGQSNPMGLLWRVTRAIPSPPPLGRRLRDSFAAARRRRIDEAVRSEFGAACPVVFVDHHLAHAAGAALTLGLRDCIAVTIDRGADGAWAVITSFAGGRPHRLAAEGSSPSLPAFLDAVCDELDVPDGPERHRQLEDLARRGVTVHYDAFDVAFRTENGNLLFDEDRLRTRGALADVREGARKEDVAASALAAAADRVRRWVSHWYVRADPQALVLGGDVFELPTMVRAVLDATDIPRARVAITPGDAGLSMGAALAGCLQDVLPHALPLPEARCPTPFLGAAYSDAEIEPVLAREGAPYRHHPRIERDVARMLAEGRTVARFDGHSEIGNGTLGNRALLRSPDGPLRRDRPGKLHGPSAYHAIVADDAFRHLFREERVHAEDLRDHPILVTPREDFARRFPDLLGWEGRVRVQTVAPDSNPPLHDILMEFRSWTGLPLLAAAPFRLPDEPLVASPLDALRSFRWLGADHAAIGRFLVSGAHARLGPELPPVPVETPGGREAG